MRGDFLFARVVFCLPRFSLLAPLFPRLLPRFPFRLTSCRLALMNELLNDPPLLVFLLHRFRTGFPIKCPVDVFKRDLFPAVQPIHQHLIFIGSPLGVVRLRHADKTVTGGKFQPGKIRIIPLAVARLQFFDDPRRTGLHQPLHFAECGQPPEIYFFLLVFPLTYQRAAMLFQHHIAGVQIAAQRGILPLRLKQIVIRRDPRLHREGPPPVVSLFADAVHPGIEKFQTPFAHLVAERL